MAGNKVNIQVGFSVDKSGLSEMQSLFQQIALKAADPGKKMDAGLQQAAKTASTLDGILTKTFNTDLGSLNVTKFNQELSKSGLSLKSVKADLSQAGNQGITAFNRLSQAILGTNQQIKQSSKLLNDMFTTFKNTVRYGISSSIFNNFANSIQKAFDYSKQLNTSLNDIRIVTDKSADSMAKFAKEANEAAKNMGASTLDYTNASLIYYQQGLSDAEVAARAETTIKAANVTGQKGEEVSEQLTAVWNGYKVSAEETELYVDKLAAVAATTAADLEELSVGMSKVASAANAMGVDFDDLNAQIATIVSVTRQAPESVGTALKTIYARMGDLSVEGGVDEFGVSLGKVSEQMQMMGIQILKENGDLRDMSSIIAEVAQKWEGWTEAQRQAAAVAMAGKRQYNNLIALFDNWDMYTNALNTSTEAMGTLQHQQDIYMESTAAKLKTLKAAWQGLYDDAINEDEINGGIEALTNLVEVFDNFVSSFGGGLKTIAGFGAILSSVFNRQIADSIVAANQRLTIFNNNLALAQKKAETTAIGTGGQLNGKEATAHDYAVEANSKVQLEYAEKIRQVRAGLNQEQANNLINLQKELGAIEEETVFLEKNAKMTELIGADNKTLYEVMNMEADELYEIFEKYSDIKETTNATINNLKSQSRLIKEIQQETHQRADTLKLINEIQNNISNKHKKEFSDLVNKLSSEKNYKKIEEEIYNFIIKKIAAERKYLGIIEKEEKTIEHSDQIQRDLSDLAQRKNNKTIEANEMLEAANSASNLTQNIVGVTSALGNMAMAWSSVNSLLDTWKNDSISVGDKLLQTFMTLGMTIPIVVSNLSKMNEAIGFTEAVTSLSTLKIEAETAAQAANNAMTIGAITLKQEKVDKVIAEMTAEELETVATNKAAAADIVQTAVERAGETVKKNYIKAIIAKVTAQKAETAATTALHAATLGFATIAITAVIAGLAIYANHLKKVREEIIATADETRKNADELRSEAESHKQLISDYENLLQQYKEGSASKEELWNVTDKLIEAYETESTRLALLSGDYDAVTASIKAAREEEEKELNQRNKNAIDKDKNAFKEKARGKWYDNVSAGKENDLIVNLGTALDTEIYGIYQEIFKDIDNYSLSFENERVLSFSVDTSNLTEVMSAYQALLKYEEELEQKGKENSEEYKNLQNVLKNFREDNAIDNLISDTENYTKGILDSLHFEEALSDSDFNKLVEQARTKLLNIVPEDEIDEKIASYLVKVHTDLSDQFFIDKTVTDKWGDQYNKALYEIVKQYDPAIQAEILDKYHFDLTMGDTEEGKRKLQEYVNYITNSPEGVYSIPFELQESINDTILKGKDINKSDWEGITEAVPNAEETLGSREEFNNKSIGERITLMEELNQKIQEEASNHIQSYEAWKQGQEAISKGLQEQIDLIQKQINIEQSRADSYFGKDPKKYDEEKKKIQELEDELENLSSQKYQVDLELNTDYFANNIDKMLGGMIGEVTTQTDQLVMAAESVGEAWTIAADDVANFASVFPELMADVSNFDWLEDGSIQLTELGKKLLNDTLKNNQQIMNSNKEVVLNAIDDKITELEADAEFQEKKIAALEEYLNSSIEDKDAEQKAIEAIEKAGAEYEDTLRESGLQQDAIAGNEKIRIGDVSNKGLVEGLDSLNENINAVRENYANIFNENYKGTLPGYKGSGTSVSSEYSKGTFGDYQGDDSHIQEAVQRAKEELKAAKDQLSEDRREIASLRGAQAQIRENVNKANKATDRVQSGHAGKEPKESKSGGGGSSKEKQKKDKELKQLDDELDKYWEINKALDAIDRTLKKIDKEQEHLNGPELIASLEKENEVLEQQKGAYQQLYEAQQAEAAQLRGQLSGMGVAFDESSGAILNYAEAVAAALAIYNAAVAEFNAGPQDEAAQKTLEAAEKAYENFKKLLDRYDTLVYTEMQDTQEKMEDIWRKEMENKLKAWKTKVELELDKNKLEQQWDEFMLKAKKDFKKVWDMGGTKEDSAYQLRTANRAKENVQNTIKRQKEVEADMDRMKAGGESELGFQSIAEARDALKELDETMRENGQTVYEAYQNAWSNYLDGIDQVADQLALVNEEFERQNEILDFNRQIIELLYGDEAYDLMDHYYEGQYKANINNIESLQSQKDMWEEQMKEVGMMDKKTGKLTIDYQNLTEDQKKLYDYWKNAQSQIYDLTVQTVKLLQDEYANSIKEILSGQRKELENTKEEWEQIKKNSEKYYDSIESTYQIQKLSSKYDQSIADAKTLRSKEKLKKLQEEELARLRQIKEEQGQISKAEIEYSEAKYQAALKEIALEEAQSNKNSMKLTRDEQGNWSYQYIAEEDDIATKRQELYDAYYELYELADKGITKNLEALMELEETYLDKKEELSIKYKDDQEKLVEEINKLDAWYYEEYDKLAKENSDYKEKLASAGAALLLTMYENDEDARKSMTDNEKQMVDDLSKNNIKDYNDIEKAVKSNYKNIGTQANTVMKETKKEWTSAAQAIADKWNKDNGKSVRTETEKTYNAIMDANEEYHTKLDELQEAADVDFGEQGLKGSIDDASDATDDLREKTEELCDDGSDYINTLREYVNELEGAWREVCDAISAAIDLLREYLQMVGEVNAASTTSAPVTASAPAAASVTPHTSNDSGSGDDKGSGPSRPGNNDKYQYVVYDGHTQTIHSTFGDDSAKALDEAKKVAEAQNKGEEGTFQVRKQKLINMGNGVYKPGDLVRGRQLASGGYTGEWGDSSGRIALLHQKELVLNADDTKNFLSGINTIRSMVASNGSIEAAVLRAASNMAYSLGNISPGTVYSGGTTNNNPTENIFNITAEFPNANSVDEIREAILSLPNIASQYVHTNLK